MTMTQDEIRARYQLRQKLMDGFPLLTAAGLSDQSHHLAAVLHCIDTDLEGYVVGLPGSTWARDCKIPDDLLAVLYSIILSERIDSFGRLLIVCGLSTVKPMHPREAERLLAKVLRDSGKTEVDTNVIATIADKTGRAPAYEETTRAGVIEWLGHNRANKFMADAVVRLCSILPEGSSEYMDRFVVEFGKTQRADEVGEYAQLARSCASRANIDRANYDLYNMGRLPESHLQQLARRATAVAFLEEMWDLVVGVQA